MSGKKRSSREKKLYRRARALQRKAGGKNRMALSVARREVERASDGREVARPSGPTSVGAGPSDFLGVVTQVRELGALRERAEGRGMITLGRGGTNPSLKELMAESSGTRDLRLFLSGLDEETVLRVQTLYYLGRDREDDPARLHSHLSKSREDAVWTLLEKMPLDRYLGEGLEMLKELGAHPDSPWHLLSPRVIETEAP
jgi:hypothetical protein